MARHPSCIGYAIHYCAFGTPWRARTRLQLFNVQCATLAHGQWAGRDTCIFSEKKRISSWMGRSEEEVVILVKNRSVPRSSASYYIRLSLIPWEVRARQLWP
eukprot:4086669-Pyramimonas_sp.AAC.1